jgi:hypothetical protein
MTMRTTVPIPMYTGYSSPVDVLRYPAHPGGNTVPGAAAAVPPGAGLIAVAGGR